MKEIKQLLEITQRLRNTYPFKNFTLDGKLVGDIGEVLCAELYDLRLYSENAVIHDGEEKTSKRKVQIKSSFNYNSYFPFGKDRMPDYFLSVNINEEGEIEELYNGSGEFVYNEYIKKNKLKPYKNSYYSLSAGILKKLNEVVPLEEKIKRLPKTC